MSTFYHKTFGIKVNHICKRQYLSRWSPLKDHFINLNDLGNKIDGDESSGEIDDISQNEKSKNIIKNQISQMESFLSIENVDLETEIEIIKPLEPPDSEILVNEEIFK